MCKIIHGKCQYSTQCVHTPNSFRSAWWPITVSRSRFGCHWITIVNFPKRVSISVKRIRLRSFAIRIGFGRKKCNSHFFGLRFGFCFSRLLHAIPSELEYYQRNTREEGKKTHTQNQLITLIRKHGVGKVSGLQFAWRLTFV